MRVKKPQVFRVCAVCGKRHGSTQGFKTALRWMGHPNWAADKAVASCVVKYGRQVSSVSTPKKEG